MAAANDDNVIDMMRWVIFAPDLLLQWQGARGPLWASWFRPDSECGVRTRALSKPCRSAPRVLSRAVACISARLPMV